jgi:hypothetical protein
MGSSLSEIWPLAEKEMMSKRTDRFFILWLSLSRQFMNKE